MQTNLSSLLKRCLLPVYYYGTWPVRKVGIALAGWAGKQPLSVLFYHRVADDELTPWTITNREFLAQIDWLTRHYELISLGELQRRVRDGGSAKPAVSITFDDGYADNCHQALPLLIARRVPCTYFVATRFVLRGEPFPHDVARGRPLAPNTVSQLRALAAAGVEIGAHTRTHRDLAQVADPEVLRSEIAGSRDDLQQLLGLPVNYFAFPFGQRCHVSHAAFDAVRAAGFQGACSAYGGYNFPGGDPFHIQRIHGDPDLTRLKNWLTLEPRFLPRSGTARVPAETRNRVGH